MSVHIEVGVQQYATLLFKLGSGDFVRYKVNLIATPGQVVALLAMCQVLSVLSALVRVACKGWIHTALLAALVFYILSQKGFVAVGSSTGPWIKNVSGLAAANKPTSGLAMMVFGRSHVRALHTRWNNSLVTATTVIRDFTKRFIELLDIWLSVEGNGYVRTYDDVSTDSTPDSLTHIFSMVDLLIATPEPPISPTRRSSNDHLS